MKIRVEKNEIIYVNSQIRNTLIGIFSQEKMSSHNVTEFPSFEDISLNYSTATPNSLFWHRRLPALFEGITLSIIIIAAIVFNGVVIWVIVKTACFRRKVHNILILNLNISYLALTVFGMPLSLVSLFTDGRPFQSHSFCEFYGFLITWLNFESLNALVSISIDRLLAVSFPLRYRDAVTREKAIFAIILTWVASGLCASPPLYGWATFAYLPGTHHCSPKWQSDCNFYYFCLIVGLGAPMILILLSYSYMAIIIRKQRHRIETSRIGKSMSGKEMDVRETQRTQRNQSLNESLTEKTDQQDAILKSNSVSSRRSTETNSRKMKAEIKVAITGALLIFVYTTLWMPYTIIYSCMFSLDITHGWRVFAMWTAYSNALFNPWVYCWTNKLVTRQIKLNFAKVCCYIIKPED